MSEGVWLHTSRHEVAGFGAVVSHGLVVRSPTGMLLVDTGWGVEETRALLAQLRARFGVIPDAAVVTHAHDDRVGGLAVLREARIPVYGTADTAARVRAEGHGALDQILAAPVDARTLAGEAVEIFAPGPAHTPDNVVVYLPARGVLFGGCMIRPAGATALGNLADADLDAWASSALRVEARYATASVVVPSHGEPGDRGLLSATTELAHRALAGRRLRRWSHLPLRDGTEVTLCGALERTNVVPDPANPVWRMTLRLEGEGPLLLRVDAGATAVSRPRACVQGRYFAQAPLAPGDPPYASRFSGMWITGARVLDDP